MYRVAVLGMVAVFCGMIVKKEKAEYAVLIGIAASIFIFGYALFQLAVVIDFVKELMNRLPIQNNYFGQLLKMLGITYVAELASGLCKDAGYQSIAGQIEIFAKLSIVALSIPGLRLFMQVVELYL